MTVEPTPGQTEAMAEAPRERKKKGAMRGASSSDTLNELDKEHTNPVSPPKKQQPKSKGKLMSTENVMLALVAATALNLMISDAADAPLPNWLVILGCLATTVIALLGLDSVRQMYTAFRTRPRGSWLDVPLTDATLSVPTLNTFANSCQVREKGLKIIQYILRGSAYSGLFPKDVAKALKSLSKTTSVARRFFKFCRWIKHFDDLSAAKEEKSAFMRSMLYLRVGANLGADWAEDVCSLERLGFLPKGTLSTEFMLFAEFCQLALALIEIGISTVVVQAQQELTELADSKSVPKQQRKLTLMRLELIKFVSDVGKAVFDCELHFAHEGVFIGCSFFSAIISTHKNMVKVLK